MRLQTWSFAGALAMHVLSTSRAEAARDAKAACVLAHDRALALESERKLLAARAEFVSCASDSCPSVLREECVRSIAATDAAIPSMVFAATASGHDVSDVAVSVDGKALSKSLDGVAVVLDPGPHSARFVRGKDTIETKFVAREGEKNRVISASFSPLAPLARIPEVRREDGRRPALLPVVLASTGVLALGGALYLRMRADAEADELRATCAPWCPPNERAGLSDKIVLSNVALGVGVVAVALAVTTWIMDRR